MVSLQTNELLVNKQAGFRQFHSSGDQTKEIEDAFQLKSYPCEIYQTLFYAYCLRLLVVCGDMFGLAASYIKLPFSQQCAGIMQFVVLC